MVLLCNISSCTIHQSHQSHKMANNDSFVVAYFLLTPGSMTCLVLYHVLVDIISLFMKHDNVMHKIRCQYFDSWRLPWMNFNFITNHASPFKNFKDFYQLSQYQLDRSNTLDANQQSTCNMLLNLMNSIIFALEDRQLHWFLLHFDVIIK